ncbi:hypothetical protein [Helicobacter pylori]|uniref:hypothetical protein n=1 Tax=Helicobacter pylori TaxID=210 RepID=UPI003569271C
MFDFANAKQLRLTPTLSNCDALLSMLANARLLVFACQQTIGLKPLILLANASLGGFSIGWIANSSYMRF